MNCTIRASGKYQWCIKISQNFCFCFSNAVTVCLPFFMYILMICNKENMFNKGNKTDFENKACGTILRLVGMIICLLWCLASCSLYLSRFSCSLTWKFNVLHRYMRNVHISLIVLIIQMRELPSFLKRRKFFLLLKC